MSLQQRTFICGGKAQAGTPIAGNGDPLNNGTSGTITIAGIPATASVLQATLFWTVLTTSTASVAGATPTFNGTGLVGTQIGAAPQSPCFPQAATVAYKADVTALVASPGNGVYAIAGYPAGNTNFVEGATLEILWSDPNGPLKEDVLYHTSTGGLLAVTLAELFSQPIGGFLTNASGPVSATLYEVIGNGQNTFVGEHLAFGGPCASLNLNNTLDGSTVAKAPGTCSSSISNQCFWDDDVWNVSAQFACAAGNGASSASLVSDPTQAFTNDCIDWPALNLLVSTDNARVADQCGVFVDAQCPPGGSYQNHGAYVSCVAHAAETFLVGLPLGGTCPRAEIQSSCVNPRARSGVGK